MISTRILLLSGYFTLCLFSLSAQSPDWVYAEKREVKYSESRYLTGFFSERDVSFPSSEQFNILKGHARNELVQSILASVVSVGKLKISNVNENNQIDTKESYEQSSVILAEADIVGLQYETYYDAKNRNVYAFAYVEIRKVVNYYIGIIDKNEKEISQKVSDAKQFEGNSDNEAALRDYFQCYPLFIEAREAQRLLIALGRQDDNSLKKNRINDLESKMESGISRLMNSESLTMDEVAYFFSFALKTQVEQLNSSIFLEVISFEDTKLESDFSKKFYKIFENKLIDVTTYDIRSSKGIAEDDEGKKINFRLSTSYWKQHDKIKIVTVLKKDRKAVAAAESSLSLKYLNDIGVGVNPGHLEKLDLLQHIRLEAVNKKIKGTYKTPLAEPLEVKVSIESGHDSTKVASIPIKFTYTQSGESFGLIYPDKNNKVEGSIALIENREKLQIITASVDIQNFLNINSGTEFYEKVLNSYNIPSVTFFLSVSGIPVYIEEDKDDFYVVPRIKQVLADNGFEFVSELENAELYIEVDAKVREGGLVYNQAISFVDAKVGVTDLKTGSNVYANAFDSVKGVDINYGKATIKALNKICKKLQDDILSYLKNR